MTEIQRRTMLLAGLGSAAMLAGAFGFQLIGGLAPCQLCLWQRWPHAAAVLILGLALLTGWRGLAWAGALAALATAGLGLFHAGVEQGWWEFVSSCTQGSVAGLSGSDLLNTDISAAVAQANAATAAASLLNRGGGAQGIASAAAARGATGGAAIPHAATAAAASGAASGATAQTATAAAAAYTAGGGTIPAAR